MRQWIKLYTEILNDPKVGRLPERTRLHMYELFLVAGIVDDDGFLPSVDDTAWMIRADVAELQEDIDLLVKVGILSKEGDAYYFTHFCDRQSSMNKHKSTSAERVKRYRDRKKEQENNVTQCNADVTQCNASCNADVTRYTETCNALHEIDVTQCNVTCNDDVTLLDKNRIDKNRIEKKREEENNIIIIENREDVTQCNALQENNVTHEVLQENNNNNNNKPPPQNIDQEEYSLMKIFCDVTGMFSIPGSELENSMRALEILKSHYPKEEDLVNYLKPFWETWKQSKTSTGLPFNPNNCKWLYDWALTGKIPKSILNRNRKDQNLDDFLTQKLSGEDGEVASDVLAKRIWCKITGMADIPIPEKDKVVEAIHSLRLKFPEEDRLIAYLTPFWKAWSEARTRNGAPYRSTNGEWLYSWAITGKLFGKEEVKDENEVMRIAEAYKREMARIKSSQAENGGQT